VDCFTVAQFLAATLLLFATPGPVIAIVAHNTLRHGTAAGLLTVVGVGLGDVCLLGATFVGMSLSGELLPMALRWLSFVGALYLVWLAAEVLLVRQRTSRKPNLSRCRKPILAGLTIAFTNPAVLLFYAAFFPQFTDPDHSISEQMLVLSALYVCTRLAFDSAWVLTVARLRLPVGWSAQVGRFAELVSAVVYVSISVITILRFIEVLG
jgi:threonine/homoserine/homoserine lactone efflux protein